MNQSSPRKQDGRHRIHPYRGSPHRVVRQKPIQNRPWINPAIPRTYCPKASARAQASSRVIGGSPEFPLGQSTACGMLKPSCLDGCPRRVPPVLRPCSVGFSGLFGNRPMLPSWARVPWPTRSSWLFKYPISSGDFWVKERCPRRSSRSSRKRNAKKGWRQPGASDWPALGRCSSPARPFAWCCWCN